MAGPLKTGDLTLAQLEKLEQGYLMETYSKLPVSFVRGEGKYLWDSEGRQYLDFLAGISVSNIGHCHPGVVEAIQRQAETLIHASNLVYTEPALKLCERLSQLSLGGKAFLSNSGAEANECAIKIARKRAFIERGGQGGQIVVFEGAFHGRTMGALSATPQPQKQEPFGPLLEGFLTTGRNDYDALRKAFEDEDVIAVLIEPIQGESGVHCMEPEFLALARELCDLQGALLIFDEVQCGLGRTGSLWAYEHFGVEPDLITTSKSLGGGVPVGACVAKPEHSGVLEVGDHGSTFAGGPLASAAALATLEVLSDPVTLQRVGELGGHLGGRLDALRQEGVAVDVRGTGLIWALDLPEGTSAKALVVDALKDGLLLNSTSDSTVRLLPPFVIDKGDIDRVVEYIGGYSG